MKKPSLAIVLTARESASLRLRHAIESALGQTYEPKAVWVVNANPSDDAFTLGLLENLKRFPQVRLLPVAGEGTEFACRNRALERVTGDFIAFMSDMDAWEPHKAEREIAALEAHPEAGVAFGNALELRETTNGIVGSALFEQASGDPQVWMLQKPVAYGSQVMYRAAALRSVQGFDEKLACYGDLDALMRIAQTMQVLSTSELPVKVHVTADDVRARQYADNRYLLTKHADFFLLHRKTAFDFCLLLARQSLETRNVLQMFQYLLRAVLKRPFRAAALLLKWGFSQLWSHARRALRRLSVRAAERQLRKALFRGKERREPLPLTEGKRRKSTALDHLREYEFVRFEEMKFMRSRSLEYVRIPDYVAVIPQGMFFGCAKLHTVVIPGTVTRIERNAFQGCERLKTVRFAKDSLLISIGAYAFAGCVSLTELKLSSSLERLGDAAFAGCVNLQSLSFLSAGGGEDTAEAGFPSSIRVIPRLAFAGCASLTRVAFQPGSMLETLEKAAFFRCAALEGLRITGAVRSLGAYALAGCAQLTALDMEAIDSIRAIGPHAFENCRSLSNLYIPHAIPRIRAYTFNGCLSLKRVKIPQGVKRIGRRAFAKCRQLETVTLMDETTAYRRSSFPRHTHVAPYKPVGGGRTA